MAQLTQGLFSVLSHPLVYDTFQNMLGADKFRRLYVSDYVAPRETDRVLDIGCGTAAIREYLPDTLEYLGFDASTAYIEAAKEKFGSSANFICQHVDAMTVAEHGVFDLVMANGILHHLDDNEAAGLASTAASALGEGGRFISHDPCYCEDQSKLARYIISRDRGQNVRRPEEYVELIKSHFREVKVSVRHNMSHIPYTHAIIVATN